MRLGLHLATLCCAAAFAAHPPIASSRRATVRMEVDEKPASDKPPFAFPSLQTLVFGFLGCQTTYTLSNEIPRLLTGATPAPYLSVALNLGFLGWAGFNLAQGAGFGKKDYYAELDGTTLNSLARDAGEWALGGVVPTKSNDGKFEVATFAGGCFWGTELHFQRLPGVIHTCVGYTQGRVERPSYAEVCTGTTGHTEGLQITFDPSEISYERLCDKLLSTVDATQLNRVGNDRGTQYRHGIYYHTPEQQQAAKRALDTEQRRWPSQPVVTELKPAEVFWPAENYHQRYLQKGGQNAAKKAKEAVRCYG